MRTRRIPLLWKWSLRDLRQRWMQIVGIAIIIALGVAMLSIAVKEVLYRWTSAVGREVGSPALEANAWHHRSDAISSIPAAIAVAVSIIAPEWAVVDRVGAVVVCLLILCVYLYFSG